MMVMHGTSSRASYQRGFALPVVMIAAVVMMMVLVSGLVAASSVNVSLRTKHYARLAREAVESGSAYAEMCMRQSNYSTTSWSTPLKPNTDCTGAETVNCTDMSIVNAQCGVIESQTLRTTFSVSPVAIDGSKRMYTVTGTVNLLRKSSRTLVSTYSASASQVISFQNYPPASRPAKRFWLFGNNAGLDFGTSGTTATPISKCASGQTCSGAEGFTVIATREGNLQFWTNGQTIWNRDGNVMLNSTGLNASYSATQAAAVIPLGSNEQKYIVITNNTETQGATNKGELFYSIVDMSLDNGRGGIPTASGNKNVPMWGATVDYASEALTAAPKPDGSGYWVLTFTPDTTRVLVFSFDNAGNLTGPTGYNAPFTPGKYDAYSGFGTLNFNNDYSQLILMAGRHCLSGTCPTPSGLLRLMNFNIATGAVSNSREWNNYSVGSGYSADFSPSGDYVYTTTLYPSNLARYKIAGTTSSAEVKASEGYIGSAQPATATSCTGGGQVLHAPDNRMYVANCGTGYLSVINNPDATSLASIGWAYNGVTLANGTSSAYGLPQMVTLYTPRSLRY